MTEDQRVGFYERLWKDFCSLQRGDANLICKDAERYRFLREDGRADVRILHVGKRHGEELDVAIDEAHGHD